MLLRGVSLLRRAVGVRQYNVLQVTKETGAAPVLTHEQVESFERDGFLHLRGAMDAIMISSLNDMCDELIELPSRSSDPNFPLLKHSEVVGKDGKIQITRIENFCKFVDSWQELTFGLVENLVSQCYREPAVLFKDKINFKGPGGAGFLPHQDATAYATGHLAKHHISVMIAVDPATPQNGCLQIVPGTHTQGVFPNTKGVINDDVNEKFSYENVITEPGDLVFFDSFLPHMSNSNTTPNWRRSGYITFNKLSEGDHNEAYYNAKLKVFKDGTGGSIRFALLIFSFWSLTFEKSENMLLACSINDDFGGKIVST